MCSIGHYIKLATRVNLAMSLHSLIGAFDANIEDWPSYVERLQHYFTANEIDSEEKHCATLLMACGPPIYRQLRSLDTPRKLFDLSFEKSPSWQGTCKIFFSQCYWCKKLARFSPCKITSARNLHILQETCMFLKDFLPG